MAVLSLLDFGVCGFIYFSFMEIVQLLMVGIYRTLICVNRGKDGREEPNANKNSL